MYERKQSIAHTDCLDPERWLSWSVGSLPHDSLGCQRKPDTECCPGDGEWWTITVWKLNQAQATQHTAKWRPIAPSSAQDVWLHKPPWKGFGNPQSYSENFKIGFTQRGGIYMTLIHHNHQFFNLPSIHGILSSEVKKTGENRFCLKRYKARDRWWNMDTIIILCILKSREEPVHPLIFEPVFLKWTK